MYKLLRMPKFNLKLDCNFPFLLLSLFTILHSFLFLIFIDAKDPQPKREVDKSKQSPSKTKKLEVSQPKLVENIVDLEESSSEDG